MRNKKFLQYVLFWCITWICTERHQNNSTWISWNDNNHNYLTQKISQYTVKKMSTCVTAMLTNKCISWYTKTCKYTGLKTFTHLKTVKRQINNFSSTCTNHVLTNKDKHILQLITDLSPGFCLKFWSIFDSLLGQAPWWYHRFKKKV